jgi:hypothetical protein
MLLFMLITHLLIRNKVTMWQTYSYNCIKVVCYIGRKNNPISQRYCCFNNNINLCIVWILRIPKADTDFSKRLIKFNTEKLYYRLYLVSFTGPYPERQNHRAKYFLGVGVVWGMIPRISLFSKCAFLSLLNFSPGQVPLCASVWLRAWFIVTSKFHKSMLPEQIPST